VKANPFDDLDAADIEKMLVVLDGGQPEGIDTEEADQVHDAFKKAGLAGTLVIRVITSSQLPEEMAAYARRMYDAYTGAGLPEELVHGLVLGAVNAMGTKAGEAIGAAA
jgi:hypothetical protein